MNISLLALRAILQFRLRSLMIFMLGFALATAWFVHSRPRLLGLEGFCPVTLEEKQSWQAGKPEFSAIFEGRKYLFAGQRERDVFETDPQRYAPVYAGIDIVRWFDENREVNGLRRHGVVYKRMIFLFDSESTLEQFWKRPDRYAQLVQKNSAR